MPGRCHPAGPRTVEHCFGRGRRRPPVKPAPCPLPARLLGRPILCWEKLTSSGYQVSLGPSLLVFLILQLWTQPRCPWLGRIPGTFLKCMSFLGCVWTSVTDYLCVCATSSQTRGCFFVLKKNIRKPMLLCCAVLYCALWLECQTVCCRQCLC